MASVFLSYSRDDAAKAQAVAAALERNGHSVWWDRQLHGGSRFSQEIEQALKRSDAVVVLWSQASVQSAWVQDEAAEGRDTNRLVPVIIDDSKPPLGFRQYQGVDLAGWKGRAGDAAIKQVHEAIVAKGGTAPQAETQSHRKAPGRDYRRLGIAAAAIAAVAIAALIYLFAWPAGRSDGDALRLRLGNFAAISQDVPQSIPDTLREEIMAALATDAVIVASTEELKAGSAPGYALNASIRRAGDLMRFTLHVVNERSGGSVWTETLDRPAVPIDLAPRQVAVAVSQVLRCGLGGAARYGKPMPDETLAIFFNYCEEYWAETLGKEMNSTRALDLARRVVAAAPDFSRGWSGFAQVAGWAARANRLVDQEALRKEAIAAAEKALELDKENSEAYEALATQQPPFAFAAREKLHEKSINVRPSDCGCEYVGYGIFLRRVGRNAEAVEAFKRAHDMIPLGADVNAGWAEALFVAGRADEAREVVADVMELWPNYPNLTQVLFRSALWTGRYDEAKKVLADPQTPLTEQERRAFAAAVEAIKNGSAAAKASALEGVQDLARGRSPNDALLVTIMAALGAHSDALSLAASAIERDGPRALPILFEPPLAAARRTPQFAQLAQRFGLIAYWREIRRLPDFCSERSPPALCARL